MIENMTMSMCASLEYCKGWNDAVGQFNRQLKAMLPETEPEMHNPADIDEICALRGRVENLTLYLSEIFALNRPMKVVLSDRHPGLPGYAPEG